VDVIASMLSASVFIFNTDFFWNLRRGISRMAVNAGFLVERVEVLATCMNQTLVKMLDIVQ